MPSDHRSTTGPALGLSGVLLAVVAAAAGGQVGPRSDADRAALEACVARLEDEVRDDAADQGFGAGGAVRLDPPANFLPRGRRLEISGGGEFRFAEEYLWAPMTFRCEWEPAEARVRRASYRPARGASTSALSEPLASAVTDCARAARREIETDARRRRYFSPTINLLPGMRFRESARGRGLEGRGTYSLDSVQRDPVEFVFSCEWEAQSETAELRSLDRRAYSGEWGEIVCESRNRQRRSCRAPIGGVVRLRDQQSDTPCALGVNWSHNSQGIEVWDGCRARFEFQMR